MKKRRWFARFALIFICIAMLLPVTVFAAGKWGYDYLEHPEKYHCEVGQTVFDHDDQHYVGGFVERVGAYDGQELGIQDEYQRRSLRYTTDSIGILTGLPALNTAQIREDADVEKTPDGSTIHTHYRYWRMALDTMCIEADTEEEFFAYYEARCAEEGKVTERVKIAGRNALKIINAEEHSMDYEVRGQLTFTEGYRYLVILEQQIPHYGVAFLQVDSSFRVNTVLAEGVTYQPESEKYIAEYQSTYDKYLNAIAGAKFTVEELDVKIKKSIGGSISDVISTDAASTPGETSVSVPAAIVVGALGIAAAIGAAGVAAGASGASAGAAGAASGEAGAESGEDTPQSTYKMYIQKDFGDCIKYDSGQQQVNARMAEVKPDGTEVDRPDLTASIDIFSGGGIEVEGCAMVGNYKGALISCSSSAADKPTQGVVSFKFTGEGGTFQNNVTFRLVGEPYFIYNAETARSPEIDFIYGAGGKFDLQVAACDFMNPPDEITVNVYDEDIGAEVEKLDEYNFIVHFVNNTAVPSEKQIKETSFAPLITAKNVKETAEDKVRINLLPEGLTLRKVSNSYMVDERFRVICYAELTAADTKEIMHTSFSLGLAIPKTDEAGNTVVDKPRLFSLPVLFGEMKSDNEKISNMAKSIKPSYEQFTDSEDSATYNLRPKQQIPQDESLVYDVVLPVSCEYNGENYTLDIPMRLFGEKLDPMAAKEEEFRKLRERIRRYVPEEEWGDMLDTIKSSYEYMSVQDLRLMSKSIIRTGITRFENEAAAQAAWASQLDWMLWGAEWVKWVGDQAFSILVNYYGGAQYGPILDSVLSPAKDIICEELGTCIAQWYFGGDVTGMQDRTKTYTQSVFTAIENVLTNLIDGKTDLKKAGALLAMYCSLRFLNHIIFEKKGLYDATLSTFADLTGQAFKFAAGMSLEKYIGNPANSQKLVTLIGNWIKKKLPVGVDGLGGDDIIKKYVEETAAMIGGVVYSNAEEMYDKGRQGYLYIPIKLNTSGDELLCDLSVEIDMIPALEKLKDFVFDQMFGIFNFPTEVMTIPIDPTLKTDI